MGLISSKAESSAPPPLPTFTNIGQAAAAALKNERPSYLELPAPVKYEDIQREVMMALKPDLFEGMRFEINKPLNPNFFLSHSLFMGNMDLATGGRQQLKTPMGHYEFGANVVSDRYMLLGRITTEGRLSGRIKYDLAQWMAMKLHLQLSGEPGQSQAMLDTDLKGGDWNAQLKLGSPSFLGLNYFQSLTPRLSAGGEFFWLHSNLKSGVGLAMRHQGTKHVATMQVATTGILSLQYAHKVNEKVTLATDFLWQFATREATATLGYDATLRQCRLRGKIDTNGVVTAFLEERFSPGINFVLSGELDHLHSNYKFGFGVVAGE
ncbi:40 kDa translocon at mitochondrial outer envelope membrane [Haematococcus lacustris]